MGQRAARAAWMLVATSVGGQAWGQSVAFGPPVAAPPAVPPAQVALAPWTAPPALDLFVGEPRFSVQGSQAFLYRRGDLAPLPFPWASPLVAATCFTAGSWVGSAGLGAPGDGLADLGWCYSSALGYQFSPDGTLSLQALYPGDQYPRGLAFARLLDRADLVLAVAEQQRLEIVPDPRDPYFSSDHTYRYPYSSTATAADTFALQTLRLGDVARTQGVDDLVWSRVGQPDLFVLWTLVALPSASWTNWDGTFLTFPGALEVRGAGAVDADGDGIPDLLAVVVPSAGPPQLLALHNPGAPLSIVGTGSAVDVGAALGLVSPRFAAPLDLDGVPAAAVFDEGTFQLHVVTADPAGGLRSWHTPTDPAWGEPTQILAGDLLGSPAADMVVVFTNGTTQVATIQVWPGDLPPAIAWAPGSPPPRADTVSPLSVAVDASDPDGPLASVELWLQGQPSGIAPSQSGARYTFDIPPGVLCALAPPSARVAVRATDGLGVWREVAADVPLSNAPALLLQGAGTTQAVPLLPGGTTVVLTAQVADGCGRPVTVDWNEPPLPPGATSSTDTSAGTSTHTITIPEGTYPAMVADPALMALGVAVTATAGVAMATAEVNLAFDATGLVAAEHASDRTTLAPGELALLTTTLRSRLAVALPQVALDDRLSGLVAAGPVRVTGATAASAADPTGLTVTLDQIPGGGSPVVVELPVRLAEASGGASRVQALAVTSGVALSPAAEAKEPSTTAAGIACGSGGASPLWLLGLLLYMKAMRRVPARTRSTSSSTPMSRQA